MILVLDASVALSWCFPDEGHTKALRLLNELEKYRVVVPTLWPLEVANALLVAERRKRIAASQANKALSFLLELPMDIHTLSHPSGASPLLGLARAYGLSVYDATYLQLALDLGAPLATLDDRLTPAARKAGVELALE